jgi:proline racemase
MAIIVASDTVSGRPRRTIGAAQQGAGTAMARASAKRSSSTVVRTYAAADRAAAEASFQREHEEAARRGWHPRSHRWRTDGREHVLTVVFVSRSVDDDARSEGTIWARDDGSVVATDSDLPTGLEPATVPVAATAVPWDAAQAVARDAGRHIIETLDLHCAGEPLRLVRSGYPPVPDLPIEERRAWAREHADHVRQRLMLEPRGHRDMYGAVLLPPHREDADIAVLFMHNEGYSTMCGHGIIALTTGLIEEGLYPASVPRTTIRWETPAGLVTATASTEAAEDGHVEVRGVSFVNVPAYLHARDLVVRPPGVGLAGPVAVQLAFGGAYYGIVDAADLGLRVVPGSVAELTRIGAAITEVLRADHTPVHPVEPDLGLVYGTIIVDMDPATSPDGRATDATMRNVTVFADAEVDRSPCGSGTSALLAWLHGAGRLAIGDEVANASITGAVFEGRIEGATRLGDRFAVSTSVAGTGYVTGYHTFVVDERDPLGDGFLLR